MNEIVQTQKRVTHDDYMKDLYKSGREITHNEILEADKLQLEELTPLINSQAFKEYEQATIKFCNSAEFHNYLKMKDSTGFELDSMKLGYPNVVSSDAAKLRRDYQTSYERYKDVLPVKALMDGSKWRR